MLQLVELAENSELFANRDAKVIALANQDNNDAFLTLYRIKAQRTGASLPILADPDGSVAKEWKVFGLKDIFGVADEYDIPSVFIINPEQKVIWRYIGKNKDDRPATTQIIRNLP